MSDTKQAAAPEPASGFKPKKSVALSGVTAGNTALCTVGLSGNDLHYRGYDILEIAERSGNARAADFLRGQLKRLQARGQV